jgi:hypothetical protein
MLSKWTQREFYLPTVYAIIRMVNDGFELGMSDGTMNWVAVSVIAAVFSIAAPKVAKAIKNGQ